MATRPNTDWSRGDSRPELPDGEVREYQEDFETDTHSVDGASTEVRPDAIVEDYLTAFTMGPVAEGDVTQGMVARAWRVRIVGADVLLARANENNTAWEPETVLFSFDGTPPTEIDVCFEQLGRAVVCMERPTGEGGASEIWLYWFDPQAAGGDGAFMFEMLGPGHSPRIALDAPLDTALSDALVFYVNGAGLVYRQQRDRYQVEHTTPIEDGAGLRVNEVGRTPDGRVLVVLSRRDEASGTYALEYLAAQLYPYVSRIEQLTAAHRAAGVELVVVSVQPPTEVERFTASHRAAAVALVDPIIFAWHQPPERFTASHRAAAIALVEPFVFAFNQPPEEFAACHRAAGASLDAIVIRRIVETEEFTASHRAAAVALEVV